MNTTIINGIKAIGLTTAVGAAGFAGYEIRGNQNEIMNMSVNPVENIEKAYDRIADSCAYVVLSSAGIEFEIIPNDPTTKSDEAFDSALIATEEGQKYVDEQFGLCMDSQYHVPISELEANAPVFIVKQLEGEEQ